MLLDGTARVVCLSSVAFEAVHLASGVVHVSCGHVHVAC